MFMASTSGHAALPGSVEHFGFCREVPGRRPGIQNLARLQLELLSSRGEGPAGGALTIQRHLRPFGE